MGHYPCCCREPGSSGSSVSPFPPDGSSPAESSSHQTLPGCEPCIDGMISRFYLIEIEGMKVGGIPGCKTSCESLDGAYVVEITTAGEDGCFGSIAIPGACQDSLGGQCYRQLLLSFGKPTPSLGVPVSVRLGPLDGDTGAGECSNLATITWQRYLSSPGQKLACLELDQEILPFLSRTGAVLYCDPSESTAYITAL